MVVLNNSYEVIFFMQVFVKIFHDSCKIFLCDVSEKFLTQINFFGFLIKVIIVEIQLNMEKQVKEKKSY